MTDLTDQTAHLLTKALPFMQHYYGKTVVIKYGGNAMGDQALGESFARDVTLLKHSGIHPVVVHGGGPHIEALLQQLGVKSTFHKGLRKTPKDVMEVVEMVLGRLNKQIVSTIVQAGGQGVGLSGKDGGLLAAKKLKSRPDLGFVGVPTQVQTEILNKMMSLDLIPVVAPVGFSRNGETLNINADTAAGAIAQALKAERFLLLSNVRGLLDARGDLISNVSLAQGTRRLKTLQGGMRPKLETCLEAVKGGVGAAVILDGRTPHAVLLELFTDKGVGTLIQARGS